jgi:predicted nucleotidyltransferase
MVAARDIQALADRIAAEFRPRRIVLFGSHAAGMPHEDSDIDLLVVLPFDGPAFRKAGQIRAALSNEFAIDIVARTPEDLERRYRLGDPIVRQAIDHGVVLYAAAA